MSKQFETGTEYTSWSLEQDVMTEALGFEVVVEDLVEEEVGPATGDTGPVVLEEVIRFEVVTELESTLEAFCLASGEMESPLEGFSLLELILWRKILRGSYSGSVPFSSDDEKISLASLNMLMRLLVYTRGPEGPIM